MKKKNIILALNELESHSLIKTVRTKKETRIEILPTYKWSSELLSEARELYPDHPLLSTGTNKEPPGTNREPPRTNKEPHDKQNHLKLKHSEQLIEDYIEDRIEDHIEDAANNNGGGEKMKNYHSELDREEQAKGCKDSYTCETQRAKLDIANSGYTVDEKKWGKVCRKIAAVSDFLKGRHPEFFRSPIMESVRDLYSGVLKVYGEECGYLLAVMYELMSRDKNLGYSRETIRNPSGFLISFVLRNSASDFEEFYSKFFRKFGLQVNRVYLTPKNDEVVFERLKSALREAMKPTLYRSIEKFLLRAYKKENVVVLVCENRMTVDFLKKQFLSVLEKAVSGSVELSCDIYA